MANRPVHFEIQADDVERAKAFYETVFGWEIQPYGDMGEYGTYYGVITGPPDAGADNPGINGGLHARPTSAEASSSNTMLGCNASVITMQVDDYDDMHEKILAAGGSVALPKFALAGMAWQGYYLDTESNTFGIHEVDEHAK